MGSLLAAFPASADAANATKDALQKSKASCVSNQPSSTPVPLTHSPKSDTKECRLMLAPYGFNKDTWVRCLASGIRISVIPVVLCVRFVKSLD